MALPVIRKLNVHIVSCRIRKHCNNTAEIAAVSPEIRTVQPTVTVTVADESIETGIYSLNCFLQVHLHRLQLYFSFLHSYYYNMKQLFYLTIEDYSYI